MLSKGWVLFEGALYKQKEFTAWRNYPSPDLVTDSLSLLLSHTHTHTHTGKGGTPAGLAASSAFHQAPGEYGRSTFFLIPGTKAL